MKESKRTVVVGIFVFLGMIIFAAGVLILGGQKKTFMKSVSVSAIFDNTGGLKKGDNVWYSGVKVGMIKDITFRQHNQIEIRMAIDKNAVPYIHKDVLAKVSSDGFVGNKIVSLGGGTESTPPIEDGDIIHVATSASTEEILNTLQTNNKSLTDIMANLKSVTSRIDSGKGTVGRLLTDDAIYTELTAALAALRQTANNTQRVTAGLADYTAGLTRKGTLANDLVTDTLVFHNLRSTMVQLDAVASHADSVVVNLREATGALRGNLADTATPAGVLLNDQTTAEDLKATLRNLRTSTYKLDENMEALQHNFLLRGFFRKRAKREAKEAERLQKEQAKQQAGQK